MVSLRAHDWFTAQTVRQALFLKQPDEKVGEGEYLCVCVCVSSRFALVCCCQLSPGEVVTAFDWCHVTLLEV